MEAYGAALGAVPQEVLDESESSIAGVAGADGIELDDRPFVARRVAFHSKKPGQAALVLVNEEQVVRPERAEWQPEKAEDTDPAGRSPAAQASARPRFPAGRGAIAPRGRRGRSIGRGGLYRSHGLPQRPRLGPGRGDPLPWLGEFGCHRGHEAVDARFARQLRVE